MIRAKKKTIIYYSNFGDILGGGEISLLTLIASLDRDSYEPVLLLPESGGMEKAAAEMGVASNIIKIKSLKSPFAPVRFFLGVRELGKYFAEQKADLIHVNATARRALCAGVAAKLAGIPAILHMRIMDSDGLLDRALFSIYPRIVANSRATASRFSKFKGAASKVTVIHNPVDVDRFKQASANPSIRKELGAGHNDVLVGVVGWLHAFKGHKYFIDAAALLAANQNIRFVIVGDGPLRLELERQAAEGAAAGAIVFSGLRDDMPDVMNALDILVLSSVKEHFGRVLIEAMACEKPVVATNAGGVPEVVVDGATGILVSPENSRALADAIAKLAADPELRASMGSEGMKRVFRMFTAEKHAEAVQNVYLEMIQA